MPNTSNGPAVASDATKFKNNEGDRQPSDDDRLRQEADQKLLDMQQRRSCQFESLETGDKVELSLALVKSVVSVPTKSGCYPDDRECFKFMKLCEARKLNPLVGDAYLIGYDQRVAGGGSVPVFNIVVAHSALLKRAEINPHYKGMKSGVVVVMKVDGRIDGVEYKAGDIVEMQGDFFLPDRHELVGGWARITRDDRDIEVYDRLNLSVFDTGYSRWAADPGGMIVKVAEASVLRTAFPGETSGMYVAEEFDSAQRVEAPTREFDIQDIDDSEDRLQGQDVTPKKSKTSKAKTPRKSKKKAPAKPADLKTGTDVEKEQDQQAAEDPKKGTDQPPVDVQPESDANDDEGGEAGTDASSEASEGQGDMFDGVQGEVPQGAEPEQQQDDAPVSQGFEADFAEFSEQITSQKIIRKVRQLRDEFKSTHKMNDVQNEQVDAAVKTREDDIRKSLAQ